MTDRCILYDVAERIGTITLNRPEQHNAVNYELAESLREAMLRADADESVRVIVLTGAGKSFCVGADISAIQAAAGAAPPQARSLASLKWPLDSAIRHDFQGTHTYFPMIGKPIICMINGATAGLGLVYAAFCDIRFSADDSVFAAAFVRRGLAAEWGSAWILPKLMGHAHATEFLLSGRKIKAPEARELGLINRSIPREDLREATYAYARDIATNCAPVALRLQKRQIWESHFQTLGESNMMFKEFTQIVLATEDVREATSSFIEKRTPNFKGR
ncbi:MAG: enoyl-CoA hydratase-related protein [Burkholderiaceae bacterium]|jgi:enoyl-CoA hydratase/carnithine racemase